MQQNTVSKAKQDIQVAVIDAIASFEKKIRARTAWYVARYQAQTNSQLSAEVTDKEVAGKAIHLMREVCLDQYLPEINLLKFLTTSSPAVFIVPAMMSVLETKQRQREIAAEMDRGLAVYRDSHRAVARYTLVLKETLVVALHSS